jgi:hydroxymethylpyrimidine pyrophosphatase-like HAD family hydrolase
MNTYDSHVIFCKNEFEIQHIISDVNEVANAGIKPPKLLYVLLKDYDLLKTQQFHKILLYSSDRALINELKGFLRSQKELCYVNYHERMIEVMPENSNKGKGMSIVANALGLDASQCCAFGDYDNDVSMFEFAGLSFAMGNASCAAKSAAAYTISGNDNDGVARILNHYYLDDSICIDPSQHH